MPKILIAGFGNKYMGDDGFGPRVVEALMSRNLPEHVEARDAGLCGVTLAPDLDDYELVIFVDAVQKGGKLGTIYRSEIKAEQVEEPKLEELEDAMNSFTLSVHETGLKELLLFAKAIGTLPPTTIVIGCEVRKISLEESLSPEVDAAVKRAVELILDEVQRLYSSETQKSA
ncbi:MAG: hydrogenase maturation protease [Methanophagales archaeon]|nr:hydrogenase maturation protease [Methanophagales archaeon]